MMMTKPVITICTDSKSHLEGVICVKLVAVRVNYLLLFMLNLHLQDLTVFQLGFELGMAHQNIGAPN